MTDVCWSWSGSKLFAKVISRQKSPLAGKQLRKLYLKYVISSSWKYRSLGNLWKLYFHWRKIRRNIRGFFWREMHVHLLGKYGIHSTLVMLNIFCTTLLPNFYPVNLHYFSYYHVFTSHLIWIYSVFKRGQIQVQKDKGPALNSWIHSF